MLLRKLANSGQSILLTIHQPSSQLFQMFDQLLLLDKSGNTLYFGDTGHESQTLIGYFERQGAFKCSFDQNPAEWILEVTGSSDTALLSTKHQSKDWCTIWAESSERQRIVHELARLHRVAPKFLNSETPKQEDEYATSVSYQFRLVTMRVFQ
jgi:ATP-binding cassette subfamily G (WHITE) protein 2 (PDR)